MNLLVTNSHAPQAYDIVRALRPYADKIIVTLEGDNRLKARLSPAANSRLIDQRYYTPAPIRDWLAGNVQAENTAGEEAYIQRLLQICDIEKITAIYPSWDPHVYVLSKNLSRFRNVGVAIPIPDYQVVLNAVDKYRTVQLAGEVGVPCPRSYLYDDNLELDSVVESEGFPLVIKPRFTSGGRGMAIVKNFSELKLHLAKISEAHKNPLIQEYVPGGDVSSVQFVLDRNGEARFVFHKKRVRKLRLTARFCTVSESAMIEPYVTNLIELLRRVGWWGACGIETILDPRDGMHKFMEINPRYPPQIWNRMELGINEPLMCLKIAQGEPVEAIKDYPPGVLFVSPMDDIQLLALEMIDRLAYNFRTRVQRNQPLDSFSAPPSFPKLIRNYLQTYTGGQRKILDPYFKYFYKDPLVSTLWWLQFASWLAGGLKTVGR